MVPGEDDPLLGNRLLVAILVEDDVVFLLQVQELVDDVDEAVLLQDGPPEVIDGVPAIARRIAFLAVEARAIRALVYREEIGRIALQLRSHRRISGVDREECEHPVLEFKAGLTCIASLPLRLGVLVSLIRELILELDAHDGDAVEVKYQVNGLVPCSREVKLPDASAYVLAIANGRSLV